MSLQTQVLRSFKGLHRARLDVFKGDRKALEAGRLKINEEFRKHLQEKDPKKIEELIQVANDTSMILRQHVVQLEQVDDQSYRANITANTYKIDNSMYKEVSEAELLAASRKRKGKRGACQNTSEENSKTN